MVGDWENTRCPKCKQLLIERHGYLITGYFLTPQGCCPSCGASIPGRWDPAFRRQITDRPFVVETREDRKSTRLNSSHGYISYAVFCLKKKNKKYKEDTY